MKGLKLAPFHIMASEGHVHVDKSHDWHMDMARRLADADIKHHGENAVLFVTPCQYVDTSNPDQIQRAIAWWEQLTKSGGEGMMVKPADFLARDRHGLL